MRWLSPDKDRNLPAKVAGGGFFLLFPGFLLYHQFVAMGLVPPFARGLFGYVALGTVMLFLALLPWYRNELAENLRNRYALLVLAFLSFTAFWTLGHYLVSDKPYMETAALQSFRTVLFWTCLFLVGLLLPLESRSLRWSFFPSFAAILAFLLYFLASDGGNIYSPCYYYDNICGEQRVIATYQGFARSALIILLFLIAISNSFPLRALLVPAGVFILFLLGSRSDFYGFLVLSAVLCVIQGIRNPKYLLIILLVVPETFLLLGRPYPFARPDASITFTSPDRQGEAPSSPVRAGKPPRPSRQLEIFDLSSSKSWQGRQALQKIAIEQIIAHPLAGKFGGHITGTDTGGYAHNALSAWVSYGLAGFLMYLSLMLAGFLVSARHFVLKQRNTPLWTFAFMLNFICLLLVIVSKSVYWALPALGWGVLTQALVGANPEQDPARPA